MQSLSGEMWKAIPGYEGFYEVSNFGRVRSLRTQKFLKPKKDKDGYCGVCLCVHGKRKYLKIHRLVAINFLPADSDRFFVNHKNLRKENNHVENLEWCTCWENSKHAFENGKIQVLWAKGSSHHKAKLTDQQVLEIFQLSRNGIAGKDLAEKYSVSKATISLILNAKRWKHARSSCGS